MHARACVSQSEYTGIPHPASLIDSRGHDLSKNDLSRNNRTIKRK